MQKSWEREWEACVVGSGRAVSKQFPWVAAENPGIGFNKRSEKIHWSRS